MEKYFNILKKTGLFDDVNNREMQDMLKCLGYIIKSYKRESMLIMEGDKISSIGILLSGGAQVIKEDIMGNRNILSELMPGNLFSETIVCADLASSPVSILATSDCEVMYIGFNRMISTCPSGCSFHTQLIRNMLKVISQKNILLRNKIDVLSQRSTRDKLLHYFINQAEFVNNRKFFIPFSRKELADFLCVDRSALSRELSRLKDEGVLDYDKNRIELI